MAQVRDLLSSARAGKTITVLGKLQTQISAEPRGFFFGFFFFLFTAVLPFHVQKEQHRSKAWSGTCQGRGPRLWLRRRGDVTPRPPSPGILPWARLRAPSDAAPVIVEAFSRDRPRGMLAAPTPAGSPGAACRQQRLLPGVRAAPVLAPGLKSHPRSRHRGGRC